MYVQYHYETKVWYKTFFCDSNPINENNNNSEEI